MQFKIIFRKNGYAFAALVCLVVVVTSGTFFRPIWYDEALTVIEFLNLPRYIDIYRCYVIPNNHICYNLSLRAWTDIWNTLLPVSIFTLRIYSVIIACLTVVFMWLFWSKRFGFWGVTFISVSYILTVAFSLYAVAVRGYMLSAFCGLLGLEFMLRYLRNGRVRYIVAMFIISLFTLGIMPSTLIFFGAITFYQFPFKTNSVMLWRWFLAGCIPILAFIIFYLPIRDAFFKVMSLKEGWSSAGAASLNFYGGFFISFLPLIVFAGIGSVTVWERFSRTNRFMFQVKDAKLSQQNHSLKWVITIVLKCGLILLAVLLPLIFFILKHPAPFPRVFWIFWIFYLYAMGIFVKNMVVYLTKRFGKRQTNNICLVFIAVIMLWGSICHKFRNNISDLITSGGNQDDYAAPYFMRDFYPDKLVAYLKAEYKQEPFVVFVSSYADHPSLLFYGIVNDIPEHCWCFDKPKEKIHSLIDIPATLFIVVRDQSDLERTQKRFELNEMVLIKDFGFQKLYKVIKK